MKSIKQYTDFYIQPDFEDYQVDYIIRRILVYLKRYKPASILEIGCAMKPVFQYVDYDYQKYDIVEPNKVFCDNAAILAEGNSRVRCYNEYFHATDKMSGGGYKFIICGGVLPELEDTGSFLKEMREVCREDTLVFISVPNANSFHRMLAKEMGLIESVYELSERDRIFGLIKGVYSMGELCEIMEVAGFQVVEKGSCLLKPFTHAQIYEMLQQGIIGENVLDGLDRMADLLPEMGSQIFVLCKIDTEKIREGEWR